MKQMLSVLLILSLLFVWAGALCETAPSVTCTVSEYKEYKNVYIGISPEDFLSAGFAYGDSCDLVFDNGKTYTDVPFYHGYFGKIGTLMVVHYPGEKNIVLARAGAENWAEAGCKEGDSVTVTLREKGRYRLVEAAYEMVYSTDRSAYATDEIFANFRAMKGGDLKDDLFYRGASPVDNKYLRAETVHALLKEKGISFVLNLADNHERHARHMEKAYLRSAYYLSLLNRERIALLGLSAAYRTPEFAQKLVNGLRQMLSCEGPYYIHCLEGKDRTGFVCLLLEGIAGASVDEVAEDYMITYTNYYGITPEKNPESWQIILEEKCLDMVNWLCGTDYSEATPLQLFRSACEAYLRKGGMTDAEIAALRFLLTGKE